MLIIEKILIGEANFLIGIIKSVIVGFPLIFILSKVKDAFEIGSVGAFAFIGVIIQYILRFVVSLPFSK